MKASYFVFVALSVFAFFCNAESISNSDKNMTDNIVNHQQSKLLIDRFNKIRQAKKMNEIVQDTTLDNICRTLITNKTYRNLDNTFNENSVRHLLYENGVIDYQYEINEVPDKDTTAIFNSFLLADDSNTIRMGYRKNANKQLLFKTKSFLQFDHWTIAAHSETLSGFNKVTEAAVITDSVICHLKTSNPGKYYYQLYNHIPLSTENLDNIKKYEVQSGITCDNQDMYDIVIKSTDPNAFFIILNKNNERIVVIK